VQPCSNHNQSSNEALRSPTSLGNSSFGIGSLLQISKTISGLSSFQIEKNAEALDQLASEVEIQLDRLGGDDDEGYNRALAQHRSAMWLLEELKTIASGVVKELKDLQKSSGESITLSKSWRGRIQSVKDDSLRSSRKFDSSILDLNRIEEPAKDLRKSQAEFNTLELLSKVLTIRKPEPATVPLDSSIQLFLEVRGNAHEFTPEAELWERFLLSDQSAREKKAILNWLEGCSKESDADLDTIVSQLEASAGTGKGTWSHGFLHTRERIKAEKRRRAVETFLESPTLRTKENTEPLVTQLDPDAPTRQDRSLEKPDDYYDRSLWLACFAMVRRGMSWEEIRDWCEAHKEGWRAVTFGMAVEKQESKTGLSGPQAGLLWRQMCLAAARHTGYDIYQRAVYGLLAGDIKSVDLACRTFDDLTYARYNALLIRSFEEFLQKSYGSRFSTALNQKFPALNSTLTEEELDIHPSEYIYKITNNPICVKEAKDPIKIIQASIIGDDFQRLITHLGVIMAYRANKDHPSRLLPPLSEYPFNPRYECIADDFDAIRLVVHIFAVYEYSGYHFPSDIRDGIIENVLVAYMDFLRLQRKIELIPTYIGLLEEDRRHTSLAVILADITDRQEQETLVKLIMEQEINMARIVTEQYNYAASLMGFLDEGWHAIQSFDILEATEDPRWPGYRIRRDLQVETDLTADEERLVRSVEWFNYVESQWRETFYGLSFAMRAFLLGGMFNGALAITKRVPYRAMSMTKSNQYLGKDVDVFDYTAEATEEEKPQLRRSTRAASRQVSESIIESPKTEEEKEERQFMIELMQSQCRQFREMQQLCLALENIGLWRDLEQIVDTRPL
jgi:nuclear pore complex protein Nup107